MGEFDKALEAGRRGGLLLRSPHDARIGIVFPKIEKEPQ